MPIRLSFDDWLAAVDRLLTVKVGLGRDDLPDCPYRDWYDDGYRPAEAAREAVSRANE